MGLFDTFLDHVTGAADEVSGDEGGGLLDGLFGGGSDDGEGGGLFDSIGGLIGGNGNSDGESGGFLGSLFGGGNDDGDSGFLGNLGGLISGNGESGDGESGGFLGSLFGGGEDGGDGGFLGGLGGLISGEGDGSGIFNNIVDRVDSYLPEELQGVAGTLFGNDATGNAATGNAATSGPAAQPAPAVDDVGDQYVNTGVVPPHLNGAGAANDNSQAEVMPEDQPIFVNDGFDDAPPAPAPVDMDQPDITPEPEPLDDFDQSIADADAMEDSFDAMLEGLG